MSRSLFVDGNDVFRNTLIQADLDAEKLKPYIEGYMDKDLQDWLGSNFYTRLDTLVYNAGIQVEDSNGVQPGQPNYIDTRESPNITEPAFSDYRDFISNHLKQITEQGAARLFLEYAPFTVSNKGVFKHNATDAVQATPEELRKIINKIKEREEFYMERAQEFLCNTSGLFPEYIQNGGFDLPPSYETYDYGFTSM